MLFFLIPFIRHIHLTTPPHHCDQSGVTWPLQPGVCWLLGHGVASTIGPRLPCSVDAIVALFVGHGVGDGVPSPLDHDVPLPLD